MPELNREYILGLTPGRLNYEIHKRLFDPNIGFNQTVPAYSEDIGLAWKVYEKLLEKHPYLELVHHKAMPGAWEPYYSLRNSTDEFFDQKKHFSGEGETAPLAICRAALLALIESK